MKEVSRRERGLPHGVIQKLLKIAEEEKNIIPFPEPLLLLLKGT